MFLQVVTTSVNEINIDLPRDQRHNYLVGSDKVASCELLLAQLQPYLSYSNLPSNFQKLCSEIVDLLDPGQIFVEAKQFRGMGWDFKAVEKPGQLKLQDLELMRDRVASTRAVKVTLVPERPAPVAVAEAIDNGGDFIVGATPRTQMIRNLGLKSVIVDVQQTLGVLLQAYPAELHKRPLSEAERNWFASRLVHPDDYRGSKPCNVTAKELSVKELASWWSYCEMAFRMLSAVGNLWVDKLPGSDFPIIQPFGHSREESYKLIQITPGSFVVTISRQYIGQLTVWYVDAMYLIC